MFTANPALALESGIYVYEKKMFGRTSTIDRRSSTIDHRPSTIEPRPDLYSKALTNQKRHIISLCRHISLYYPASPKGGGWRSNSIGGGEVPHPPWRGGLPGDLPPGDPPGGSPGGGPQSGDLFFSLFSLFFCCFFHLFFTPGVKNFTPRVGGTPHLN